MKKNILPIMIPVMLILLSSCNSRQKEIQEEITQADTPIYSGVTDTTVSGEATIVMTGSQIGVDSMGSITSDMATGSIDHTGAISPVSTPTLDATGTDSPLVVRTIAQVSTGTQSATTGAQTTPVVRIEGPGQTIETPSVTVTPPPTRTTPSTPTNPAPQKPTPTTPVKTPTQNNTQPTSPPPVVTKPATPASVTTDRTVTYRVPDGDAKMHITIVTKEGTISSVVIKNMASDQTSKMYQDQFIKSVSAKVVGKPVKGLQISIIAGASLTTESFNTFLKSL